MAGLTFEGDLSNINEHQLKFVRNIIEKRGYRNNKVILEPVGKAGDNYVANVMRIIVEDDNMVTFKMVAKVAPAHGMMRQMTNMESLFRNEHIMYTKVLPKLTQLEIAADVPPEDRLRYAACYGSSNDVPNEIILLEDLNESNFIMLDRMKPISPECVKSVLKNFATLHSLSYAFKSKEPEMFDEYKNSLFDLWDFVFSQEETIQFYKQVENNSCKIVESDVHKKALNGIVMETAKEMRKMAKYEKHSKHAVIQQGDSWTNNIMFKFDGETLLESIMIDYQLSKPTNPAADILYMILNCTDYETRKEHFQDWIDYYHMELDKSLSNYGLKANFVFPRDQLDADLKRYGKLSFGLSFFLVGVLVLKTEEASGMKKAMETNDMQTLLQEENVSISSDPETIALMKKRLEELVDSCQELGLI